jgi:hypothetical protein
MVRISISQAAFDALADTLPLGSVGYENATNERGERLVWLAPTVVDRLRAMRGPGESYSDVILRIAERNERDNQGNWRSFATSASSGPITRSFRSTSNWAGLS